ncbi:HIT domain-containing protein [Candidatus Uhrbacteria bacterium]|nr:HIT domain-containing protein [Candidatus Uhrbacteria bacterium]
MDCLFCKIAAHEVESDIIYEDDKVIAFLDINPVNHGHTLVVPKKHSEQLLELPDELAEPVIATIKKIMRALMNLPDVEGVNVMQNNYEAAGQVVPHVHFHVIPRKKGDGHRHWPGIGYAEGEAALMTMKLKDGIK